MSSSPRTQRLGHCGHLPARLRATTAGRSTRLHLSVLTHLLTLLRALFADLSTYATGTTMEHGAPEHKVRARLADLGTVEQRRNVAGLRVLAAHLQAVCSRLYADPVTVQTVLNALLHFRTQMTPHRVVHHSSSL